MYLSTVTKYLFSTTSHLWLNLQDVDIYLWCCLAEMVFWENTQQLFIHISFLQYVISRLQLDTGQRLLTSSCLIELPCVFVRQSHVSWDYIVLLCKAQQVQTCTFNQLFQPWAGIWEATAVQNKRFPAPDEALMWNVRRYENKLRFMAYSLNRPCCGQFIFLPFAAFLASNGSWISFSWTCYRTN